MCFSSPKATASTLPPTPPAAPQMADPAAQLARDATQKAAQKETGLAGTNLTVNLGGQGGGKQNLAGTK